MDVERDTFCTPTKEKRRDLVEEGKESWEDKMYRVMSPEKRQTKYLDFDKLPTVLMEGAHNIVYNDKTLQQLQCLHVRKLKKMTKNQMKVDIDGLKKMKEALNFEKTKGKAKKELERDINDYKRERRYNLDDLTRNTLDAAMLTHEQFYYSLNQEERLYLSKELDIFTITQDDAEPKKEDIEGYSTFNNTDDDEEEDLKPSICKNDFPEGLKVAGRPTKPPRLMTKMKHFDVDKQVAKINKNKQLNKGALLPVSVQEREALHTIVRNLYLSGSKPEDKKYVKWIKDEADAIAKEKAPKKRVRNNNIDLIDSPCKIIKPKQIKANKTPKLYIDDSVNSVASIDSENDMRTDD